MMRPLTYERRWYKKIAFATRARVLSRKEEKKGRRDRARGRNDARNAREEKRPMRWKSSRVLFGGRFGAFGVLSRWRDSRFLDLFFVVVVFELSLSESDDDDERVKVVSFSRAKQN